MTTLDVTQEEIVGKKELGQFFSGEAVASLLLKLAKVSQIKRAIDPMCGTGDLLASLKTSPCNDCKVTGIEIDPAVHERAQRRFEACETYHLINANVFSPESLRYLASTGSYDLVITNPPYVRRETARSEYLGIPGFLRLQEIRQHLLDFLSKLNTLDHEEKKVFNTIIQNFSGLSDIAVPSWILCSMLVKKGGKIAMVLPEAWLSRDYALIIKYLLLRFFRLEYIIEDANSSWFRSAQVKTMLLVGERITCKHSIRDWNEADTFTYVSLYAASATENSLVKAAFNTVKSPERDFIHSLDAGISKEGFFSTRRVSLKAFSNDLINHSVSTKWFKLIEAELSPAACAATVKGESSLRDLEYCSTTTFQKLQDMGVLVGQGLRTGANSFFYLNFKDAAQEQVTVFPLALFNYPPFQANRDYFKPVVRRQAELDNSFSLHSFQPKGVVLTLHHHVLSEDEAFIRQNHPHLAGAYGLVDEPMGNYIRRAALCRNGAEAGAIAIPNLSAVKSNRRSWNPRKPHELPRFWYMLPEFAPRHSPDLFIPRVITGGAKARLNQQSALLIDANFSTLWVGDATSLYDPFSLLALLNSSYAVVAMEEYGTVMGGGALKLEATQLRRIPFPTLTRQLTACLAILGRDLASPFSSHSSILLEIDKVILSAMGFGDDLSDKLDKLSSIKKGLLKKRLKQ